MSATAQKTLTPLQRAELKIKRLERLYDEQYILIENYKDFAFGSKHLGIKILWKHKEEYGKLINNICINIEKFILECEKIAKKLAGKNVQLVSIGLEKNSVIKYQKNIINGVGYRKWQIFKANKAMVTSAQGKATVGCFEQDIWRLLKLKFFIGIDDSVLDEKLEYVFDSMKLDTFLASNGTSVKSYTFFKNPLPNKEQMREKLNQRKHLVDMQGETNPYKTAEKIRAPEKPNKPTENNDSDASDSDEVMNAKQRERERKKKEKKEKKEKRAKKEQEKREERKERKTRQKGARTPREGGQRATGTGEKEKGAP